MVDTAGMERLAVALGIGMLVGLERGWRQREAADGERAAGLRTFALSGLAGGVAAALSQAAGPWVLAAALLAHSLVMMAFPLQGARAGGSISATTTVAGLLTFLLGAFAQLGEPWVAVSAAVAMTLVLASRETLHRWVRAATWEEVRAVLALLAMSFLLLPVLPDRPVDPWGAVNPAEIWMMAILVAGISFGGYVAVRLLGERLGVVVAAAVGGLVSSTAVTATLARLGRAGSVPTRLPAGGILVAGAVMVGRVALVTALLDRGLALALAAPLGAVGLVLALSGLLLVRGAAACGPAGLAFANPLEVGTALKLSCFVALVMLAAAMAGDMAGGGGVLVVAAASGLADVDAVTLSMARAAGGSVPPELARAAILVAVGANTATKAAMAGWLGGRSVGLPVAVASLAAIAAGAAALFT